MMSMIWHSLSGRLLFLTVLFVMLAEVLIFVPSAARFREDFLMERLEKGRIAALAATEARDGMPSPELQREVLRAADLFNVVMMRGGQRKPMLTAPIDSMIDETFDLRKAGPFTLIADAVAVMAQTRPRFIRVIGAPEGGDDVVEVVLAEQTLRNALMDYCWRIFVLSLFISALTASLVFLAINAFLLAPIRRIISGIMRFREDPEDGSRVLRPSGARGEIGLAERELAGTQTAVVSALKQKSRLAALGEAVAKINHDLRNILASSQLLADRLESSQDPLVRKVGPKLIASLDRAIRLCQQTLAYGRAEEAPPQPQRVEIARLADEVGAALGLTDGEGRSLGGGAAGASIRFQNGAPAGLSADLDPDQMFRALLNIARNACQALDAAGRGGTLLIEAAAAPGRLDIDVVDDGPGLPEEARKNLFKAFKGSSSRGGSGLGLAIASELVRAHGGALSLVESGDGGTRFRVSLPVAGGASALARRPAAASTDNAA